MKKLTENLDAIIDKIRVDFTDKDAARERVLPLCRELIRYSGNIIRSVHRQEFKEARDSLEFAGKLLEEIKQATSRCDELRYTGFVRDAQKEYAEACTTLSLVLAEPLPGPEDLKVDSAAYLNGLGEAVGELRRYLLDSIRHGDLSRGEELLSAMDDIYGALVTMDFPDAITSGLRRTTDNIRGILEKTRADFTLVVREQYLENKLADFNTRKG